MDEWPLPSLGSHAYRLGCPLQVLSPLCSIFQLGSSVLGPGNLFHFASCWELLRQLLISELGLSHREEKRVNAATDTWIPRTTGGSSPRSSPMSWPHPDTTKFLLPRVAAKRKNFYCPPPISTSPFACIALPLPLISICTSPFACAFKPWIFLNTLGSWYNFRTVSVSLLVQGPRLSLPPIKLLGGGPLEILK